MTDATCKRQTQPIETCLHLYKLMHEAVKQRNRIWRCLSVNDERYDRIMRRTLERVERRRKAYKIAVYGYDPDENTDGDA